MENKGVDGQVLPLAWNKQQCGIAVFWGSLGLGIIGAVAVELVMPIVMYWLVLHAPGGHEVSVNVKRINSMHAGEGGNENKLFTREVRCVISMDNGKLVNTIETCEQVRRAIEELEKQEEQ